VSFGFVGKQTMDKEGIKVYSATPTVRYRYPLIAFYFCSILVFPLGFTPVAGYASMPPAQSDGALLLREHGTSTNDPLFAVQIGERLENIEKMSRVVEMSLGELQELLNDASQYADRNTAVIAAMFSGHQDEGSVIFRIRTREAILAAADTFGFKAADPWRRLFIRWGETGETRVDSETRSKTAAVELFQAQHNHTRTSSSPSLVFIWLDENQLWPKPLESFLSFLNELSPPAQTYLLGPATSDTLRAMVEEAKHRSPSPKPHEHFTILSPFVTVPNKYFFPEASRPRQLEEVLAPIGIRFLRTISDDDAVAESIIDELSLRGLDITKPETGAVLLVSERESFYAQALTRTFRNRLERASHGALSVSPDPTRIVQPLLLEMSYSRNQQGDSETRRRFFEYLQRLAEQAKSIHVQLRRTGNIGFRGIGILGSASEDKLPVITAFRRLFPHALFFTTDLDDRLLQTGDFPATRNMVIGAGFGLTLSDDLQFTQPPFQDTYQTSTYLAALIALSEIRSIAPFGQFPWKSTDQSEIQAAVSPRIFEVGRHGAFDLSPVVDSSVHPAPDPLLPELSAFAGLFYVAILAAMTFYSTSLVAKTNVSDFFHRIRRNPRRLLLPTGLGVVWIALVTAVFVASPAFSEPFSLFEGISVWPTEGLRVLAIGLAIAFFTVAHRTIARRNWRVAYKYGFTDRVDEEIKQGRDHWREFGRKHRRYEPWELTPKDRLDSRVSAASLWGQFQEYNKPLRRLFRVLPASVLLMLLVYAINSFTDSWSTAPIRGHSVAILDTTLVFIVHFLVGLMAMYQLDIARSAVALINQLARPICWPTEASRNSSFPLSPAEEDLASLKETSASLLAPWVSIRFARDLTDAYSRFVYFPFIIIFLLFLSQSRYFDDWGTPIGTVAVYAIVVGIGIYSVVMIRQSAEGLKNYANDVWSKERVAFSVPHASTLDNLTRVDNMVSTLRKSTGELTGGAFVKFTREPLLKATLIPLTTIAYKLLEDLVSWITASVVS
jgi:hypothetical protein